MIYRVYEFTTDFKTKLSEFDLDLSSVASGGGRQASAIYYNGYYYMVVPTSTESGNYFESMVTPSDLLLIKLNQAWEIVDSKFISQEPDSANFATGFQVHNDYFLITYKQGYKEGSEWAFVSPLKVYDQDFNLVFRRTCINKIRYRTRIKILITIQEMPLGLHGGYFSLLY